MSPEKELKSLCLESGAEVAGIASAAEFINFAPAGHRPEDLLLGAQSVVVFGGRTIHPGAWRSPMPSAQTVNRDFPRKRAAISQYVAHRIEARYGYYALPHLPPPVGFNPSLSLKLCAELAGLGQRSLAGGVILNSKVGFVNFYACLTDMPLKSDGPSSEVVCPHPACQVMWHRQQTTPCLRACPQCLDGELEKGRIKWQSYDRIRCSTRAQTFSESGLQAILVELAEEPELEARRSLALSGFTRRQLQALAYGSVVAQCLECLRYCPVCASARRLKPRSFHGTDLERKTPSMEAQA